MGEPDREAVVVTLGRARRGVQRAVTLVIFFVLIGIGLWVYHQNAVNIRKQQLLCAELKSSVQALLPFCSSRLENCGSDLARITEDESPDIFGFLRELEGLGGEQYYFVLDKLGQSWANGGNPHLSLRASGARPGPALFSLNPESKKPVEDLVTAGMGGGGLVEYAWNSPGHRDEKRPKISYVEHIPRTGLLLGRGSYL